MNLSQILNMVLRIVTRRAVELGVNKAIDVAARRGKAPAEMTPEDHKAARASKASTRKAREAMRITRRFLK